MPGPYRDDGNYSNSYSDYPPSGGPPRRRRGSDDYGLANQMENMNLGSQVPDRPHTSNAIRPIPSRTPTGPQSGGYNAPDGYGPPRRAYTDASGPPPPRGPQRSATNPGPRGDYSHQSPMYPGQSTYQEVTDYDSQSASLSDKEKSDPSMKYKTYSTYVHHNVFASYFDEPDKEDEDELDMPNFDGASSKENHREDDYSASNSKSTEPSGGNTVTYKAYRPPNSPVTPVTPVTPVNQFENAGFQFDLPTNTSQNSSHVQSPESYNSVPGGIDEPQSFRAYQPDMYQDPEPHPDSLPAHPTPYSAHPDHVSSPQGPPPPIRQYSNAAPQAGTDHSSQPGSPNASGDSASKPVTRLEIERLELAVRSKPDDYETQLTLAKKLAEASVVLVDEEARGDPRARNKIREKYVNDAHKIVKKLVHHGYPEAMFYMADCYGTGALGLPIDPKEAFPLYQSAAKAGHAEAAYRTAVCCELGYEEGGGTRRDALKAVQWYRRAAALGNTPAMYKMGVILLKGLLGQQKSPREGVTWLKRAAERADEENPHALHELALLYESAGNSDVVIRDEAYALQLFTQAANLGYKFSQYRLGASFEHGLLGCPIDARQSIIWYTRAAAQGEHQAELALSGWYLTGAEGILQQSDTEAYLWARKAASSGLAKAEYAMGYFTEVGIGVPPNLEDAKRWYWRAACTSPSFKPVVFAHCTNSNNSSKFPQSSRAT